MNRWLDGQGLTYIHDSIPVLGACALNEAFRRLDGGHGATIRQDELAEFGEEVRGPAVRGVDYGSGTYLSVGRRYRDPAVGIAL